MDATSSAKCVLVLLHMFVLQTAGFIHCPNCQQAGNVVTCQDSTQRCASNQVCMGTMEDFRVTVACGFRSDCEGEVYYDSVNCTGGLPFAKGDKCHFCCHDPASCRPVMDRVQQGIDGTREVLHCPTCPAGTTDPLQCLNDLQPCQAGVKVCKVQWTGHTVAAGCDSQEVLCRLHESHNQFACAEEDLHEDAYCTRCCSDAQCLHHALYITTTTAPTTTTTTTTAVPTTSTTTSTTTFIPSIITTPAPTTPTPIATTPATTTTATAPTTPPTSPPTTPPTSPPTASPTTTPTTSPTTPPTTNPTTSTNGTVMFSDASTSSTVTPPTTSAIPSTESTTTTTMTMTMKTTTTLEKTTEGSSSSPLASTTTTFATVPPSIWSSTETSTTATAATTSKTTTSQAPPTTTTSESTTSQSSTTSSVDTTVAKCEDHVRKEMCYMMPGVCADTAGHMLCPLTCGFCDTEAPVIVG